MNTLPNQLTRFRYLPKSKWIWITDNKFILKRNYRLFFKRKITENLKSTVVPKGLFTKSESIFWIVLFYKLYPKVIRSFNRKIINFKFIKKINSLFIKNIKNFTKLNKIDELKKKKKTLIKLTGFSKLNNFFSLYNYFFKHLYRDVFFFFKRKKNTKRFYKLIMTFSNNKLSVNIQNPLKENIIFLAPGLLIKFFEKKKSMKKSKTLKFLLMKYLRKLLLITRIRNMILLVKKTPALLLDLLNLINQNIAHKFLNPFTRKEIEEKANNFILFKFTHFIFLKNSSFVKNKIKKKGRIKRKVLQKIIFANRIVD